MQRVLKRYGIRPKKTLGQNFLQDRDVLRREVAYAELSNSDTVLEIGPGIGNLTELLLQRAGRVVAVERDEQFRGSLEELQAQYGNLELIWGDALEVDFPPFDKVVANLPFKPALPLTFKLLEQRFDRAVLICQKRLAERICASVGERGYCRLGITIGRRANAELLEVVPRNAFYPQPEVDSAIVQIRKARSKFPIPSDEFFRFILESLFVHRSKALEQAARNIRDRRFSPDMVNRSLASLSAKIRNKPVYQVTPREFGKIAQAFWNGMDEGGCDKT